MSTASWLATPMCVHGTSSAAPISDRLQAARKKLQTYAQALHAAVLEAKQSQAPNAALIQSINRALVDMRQAIADETEALTIDGGYDVSGKEFNDRVIGGRTSELQDLQATINVIRHDPNFVKCENSQNEDYVLGNELRSLETQIELGGSACASTPVSAEGAPGLVNGGGHQNGIATPDVKIGFGHHSGEYSKLQDLQSSRTAVIDPTERLKLHEAQQTAMQASGMFDHIDQLTMHPNHTTPWIQRHIGFEVPQPQVTSQNGGINESILSRGGSQLLQTVDVSVRETAPFYTSVLLPATSTDNIHVKWNIVEMNQQLAGRVPHEGVTRLLTSSHKSRSAHAERRGLAMVFNKEFYQTPEGSLDFLKELQGLIRAVQNTINLDVMAELMKCQRAQPLEAQLRDRSMQRNQGVLQHMRQDVEFYACMQRQPHSLEKIIAAAKATVGRIGGRVDTVVLPPGALQYLQYRSEYQPTYSYFGSQLARGVKNAQILGCNVYEAEHVLIGTSNDYTKRLPMQGDRHCPLVVPTEVGERYDALHDVGVGSTHHRIDFAASSANVTPAGICKNSELPLMDVYNEDNDRWERITKIDALLSSDRFCTNPTTGRLQMREVFGQQTDKLDQLADWASQYWDSHCRLCMPGDPKMLQRPDWAIVRDWTVTEGEKGSYRPAETVWELSSRQMSATMDDCSSYIEQLVHKHAKEFVYRRDGFADEINSNLDINRSHGFQYFDHILRLAVTQLYQRCYIQNELFHNESEECVSAFLQYLSNRSASNAEEYAAEYTSKLERLLLKIERNKQVLYLSYNFSGNGPFMRSCSYFVVTELMFNDSIQFLPQLLECANRLIDTHSIGNTVLRKRVEKYIQERMAMAALDMGIPIVEAGCNDVRMPDMLQHMLRATASAKAEDAIHTQRLQQQCRAYNVAPHDLEVVGGLLLTYSLGLLNQITTDEGLIADLIPETLAAALGQQMLSLRGVHWQSLHNKIKVSHFGLLGCSFERALAKVTKKVSGIAKYASQEAELCAAFAKAYYLRENLAKISSDGSYESITRDEIQAYQELFDRLHPQNKLLTPENRDKPKKLLERALLTKRYIEGGAEESIADDWQTFVPFSDKDQGIMWVYQTQRCVFAVPKALAAVDTKALITTYEDPYIASFANTVERFYLRDCQFFDKLISVFSFDEELRTNDWENYTYAALVAFVLNDGSVSEPNYWKRATIDIATTVSRGNTLVTGYGVRSRKEQYVDNASSTVPDLLTDKGIEFAQDLVAAGSFYFYSQLYDMARLIDESFQQELDTFKQNWPDALKNAARDAVQRLPAAVGQGIQRISDSAQNFLSDTNGLDLIEINIIVNRPFIRHMMGATVAMQAGVETGGTLYGGAESDLLLAEQGSDMVANLTFYSKAFVKDPRRVDVYAGTFACGYVDGNNVEPVLLVQDQRLNGSSSSRHDLQGSVFYSVQPRAWDRRSTQYGRGAAATLPYDLTGVTPRVCHEALFDLPLDTDMQSPWHPCGPFDYLRVQGWKTLGSRLFYKGMGVPEHERRLDPSLTAPRMHDVDGYTMHVDRYWHQADSDLVLNARNTKLYGGSFMRWSSSGAATQQTEFVQGNGHWKSCVGPQNRDARSGRVSHHLDAQAPTAHGVDSRPRLGDTSSGMRGALAYM